MKSFVLTLFSMSLWGGLATLLIWAACALLRRLHAPARLLRGLWPVAALRYLCPLAIPLTLPQAKAAGLPAVVRQASAAAPAAAALAPAQPQAAAAAAAAATAGPTPAGLPTIWILAAAVWAAGFLVLAVRAFLSWFRLHRSVALACKTIDGCYSCGAVSTPFTLGLFPSKIYLPAGLTGSVRRAVILHERAHIRRGDPFFKPLFYLAACLHWFNPLARFAFTQFCREMEATCDEAATCGMAAPARADYCESILQFAVQPSAPMALAFGEGQVRRRIARVLQYRRPSAPALVLCAGIVLCLGTACMLRPDIGREPAPTQTAAITPQAAAATPEPSAQPAAVFTDPLPGAVSLQGMTASHKGADLSAPLGTPVYAAAAGTVTTAGSHYSYGNYVEIDHGADAEGQAWRTLYAHLDTLSVSAGQTVAAGQQIGTVGQTGNTSGVQLHLELFRNGTRVQPGDYIPLLSAAPQPSAQPIVPVDADFETELLTALTAEAEAVPERTVSSSFSAPLKSYTSISCIYGLNGHNGTDFAAAPGTPVQAAADGRVVLSAYQSHYGSFVLLYHGRDTEGNTYATLYSQLDTLGARAGQSVAAGDVLGTVGSTGNSTGPHLHLELRINGGCIDPAGVIPFAPA